MWRPAQPRDRGENEPPSARRPARVRLPAHLVRLFADGATLVEVEAADVRELMAALEARWPGMRDRLCDTTPAIRRHINVFVDGRRARLDTRLAPGADVFVITAISGG